MSETASHPFVHLAKQAIEIYIQEKRILSPPDPLPDEMKGATAVFVSLKKEGNLRGCIGTITPTQKNLAQEIITNAIAAATQDPRFPPVLQEEFPFLKISVDVLTPPEIVSNVGELNPKKEGVIVAKGGRRGVLLPDLPGIQDAKRQIQIAQEKAGIHDLHGATIYKFRVARYY